MTLTFEQTIDDVIALRMFHENEKRFNVKTRFRVMLVMVAIGVAVIGYVIYKNPEKADPIKLTYAFSAIVFIGLARSPWVYKYRAKNSISKGEERKLLGERTFVFKEDYLQVITSDARSEINWNQFMMMKETNDYLYLFLTPAKAFIIPKRIFLLDQELHDVKSFMERKVQKH